MKMRQILIYFYHKYNGNYRKMLEALKNKERVEENELNEMLKNVNEDDYVTIIDNDYPSECKELPCPLIVYNKKIGYKQEWIKSTMAFMDAN